MTARRWVLVALTGDGPLEAPRVWGPWRSLEKAEAALARYELAEGDNGRPAQVAEIEPEYGGRWSLAQHLRELRAADR